MKGPSNAISRIVMIVVFIAVLIYFGVAVLQSFQGSVRTQPVYASVVEDRMEVTGFLVREELPLRQEEQGVVDVLLSEGEKAAAYQTIANVYQSSDGPELTRQIQQLEQELEQLRDTQSRSIDTSDTIKLSDSILSSLATLQTSVAQGNLANLEAQTSALKSLIFKRSYTYEGNDVTLDEAIAALAKQLDGLRATYARSTTVIRTDQPGIYSGLVDGYEGLLFPNLLATTTPTLLDNLVRYPPNVDEESIGKLITSSSWYFTFPCTAQEAARFVVGMRVSVRFTRDISKDLDMRVFSVGEEENGRMVVTLSSNRFLSATTLLRQQTVDIVFGIDEGLYIPASALRVDENGVPGIYTVVGVQAEYKPVQLVAQGDGFFLVLPGSTNRTALRQGEEVIVSGVDLFDGKVVR
jgi:hypothetical protein